MPKWLYLIYALITALCLIIGLLRLQRGYLASALLLFGLAACWVFLWLREWRKRKGGK